VNSRLRAGVDILRIRDDRLVESWAIYDRMELMTQIQG
jgi:predicted ester cyclase